MKVTLQTTKTPATRPMMIAAIGLTPSQGAVMATRPARAPLNDMEASGFLNMIQEVAMAAMAAVAADRFVVTAIQPMLMRLL